MIKEIIEPMANEIEHLHRIITESYTELSKIDERSTNLTPEVKRVKTILEEVIYGIS